jgi:hypothetical protein
MQALGYNESSETQIKWLLNNKRQDVMVVGSEGDQEWKHKSKLT